MAVLRICHHLVMDAEVASEWDRERSGFARDWRVSMFARKKVFNVADPQRESLTEKIRQATHVQRDQDAMLDDLHLVEAALAADETIISLDDSARGLFAAAAQVVGELRSVVWVNPSHAEEDILAWLESGAQSEERRQLGGILSQ